MSDIGVLEFINTPTDATFIGTSLDFKIGGFELEFHVLVLIERGF